MICTQVPEGTTKFDVSVTLQRDALRVYVKGLGSLVDGVLNRAINLKESTWALDDTELVVVLAKLEKTQAWQRLMVGGNEITVEAAYRQMGDEAPERGAVAYDDMDEREKAYVRARRELDYARAAGDDELVDEILADLEAMDVAVAPDVDRPYRDEQLEATLDLDEEEARLRADQFGADDPALLEEKRAHAAKFGWA